MCLQICVNFFWTGFPKHMGPKGIWRRHSCQIQRSFSGIIFHVLWEFWKRCDPPYLWFQKDFFFSPALMRRSEREEYNRRSSKTHMHKTFGCGGGKDGIPVKAQERNSIGPKCQNTLVEDLLIFINA